MFNSNFNILETSITVCNLFFVFEQTLLIRLVNIALVTKFPIHHQQIQMTFVGMLDARLRSCKFSWTKLASEEGYHLSLLHFYSLSFSHQLLTNYFSNIKAMFVHFSVLNRLGQVKLQVYNLLMKQQLLILFLKSDYFRKGEQRRLSCIISRIIQDSLHGCRTDIYGFVVFKFFHDFITHEFMHLLVEIHNIHGPRYSALSLVKLCLKAPTLL